MSYLLQMKIDTQQKLILQVVLKHLCGSPEAYLIL